MARLRLAAATAALLCLHCGSASANEEAVGDVITGVLPLSTYALTWIRDDREGGWQFLRSTGATLVVNTALRLAFNETSWGERPNGHEYGFPSGHASFMTSSAAFLQDRYGWKFGVPAYALVAYVSHVRVDTGHHRWRDIAAGVAVGWTMSKFFVTPEDATHLAPIIGPDFLGFRWERSF